MIDYDKLAMDMRDAVAAGKAAAEQVPDGGSCSADYVVLSGIRWSKKVERLLPDAHSSKWLGRKCIKITPPVGMASKRLRCAEAMCDLLRARGWDATVFYQMD
jgi:hypothetical protein